MSAATEVTIADVAKARMRIKIESCGLELSDQVCPLATHRGFDIDKPRDVPPWPGQVVDNKLRPSTQPN